MSNALPLRVLVSTCFAAAVAATVPLRSSSAPAGQQQPCAPPAIEASTEPNLFTEEQETFLGDAIAEQADRDFRVLQDAAVTAPLQAIADRLMQRLPNSQLKIQTLIIELPEANAFVLPGGRIMVARKMISFVSTEDELAGVLAHELGHLVTRQQSAALSRQFKKVLNVTSVGDRADVVEKYHQLLDNAARNPRAFRQDSGHESREQIAADRMGIYLLASAGYDPAAFAQFWDRYAQTGGKTGGFFSDLFGTTSPDARRLKEALRNTTALTASCIAPKPTASDQFRQWQNSVRSFVPRAAPEKLHNVVSRTRLDPALRSDITHLRFSPDGRYILAQDDGGVSVLTRAPLAQVFRISGIEALPATFTPDSSRIILMTPGLRVETWRVSDRRQESVHEIVSRDRCMQARISFDGKTIACFDTNWTLQLIDVASGATVFQKKPFFAPSMMEYFTMLVLGGDLNDGELVTMGFSTNNRFFIASHRGFLGESDVVVLDMETRAPLPLKGHAKKFIATNFVFTGPDRLLAANPDNLAQSATITLPAGAITGPPVALMNAELAAVTKGDYLLVRPMQKFAVGVLELAKGVGTKGFPSPAVDVYDDVFVAERGTGELGMYSFANNQLVGQLTLAATSLGRIRAVDVSPDFKWLALSERSRGGVFDLVTGRRMAHMRGFRGADIDETGRMSIDIPRYREEARRVAHFDLAKGQGLDTVALKEASATQYGGLLVVKAQLPRGPNIDVAYDLDVRNVHTNASLWKRRFDKDLPQMVVDGANERVILGWPASSLSARDEVRKDPVLRKRLEALKESEGDWIVQVLEGRTGKVLGTVFVETGKGSFSVVDAVSSGDWLAIEDTEGRTRLYSVAAGELKGRVFGRNPLVHGGASLFALQSGSRVSIYDAATVRLKEEFTFARNVAHAAFNADGTKLLALLTDHSVVVVGMGGAGTR